MAVKLIESSKSISDLEKQLGGYSRILKDANKILSYHPGMPMSEFIEYFAEEHEISEEDAERLLRNFGLLDDFDFYDLEEDYSSDKDQWSKIAKSILDKAGVIYSSSPSTNYGNGHLLFDATLEDGDLDKIVSAARSQGFKEADRYVSTKEGEDSWVVLTRENDEGRLIFGVVTNPDSTEIDIGYSADADDNKWFGESLTESPEQEIDTYLGIINGSIRKAIREYDRTGSLFELRRELFSIKNHATKALKVVDALDLERHSEDQ